MRRSFGCDVGSDTHGRHALRQPGGDNRQRDVLHLVNHWVNGYRMHPTRVSPDYIGAHRRPREDHFIAALLTSGWAV